MAQSSLVRILLAFFGLGLGLPSGAQAMTYYDSSLESVACDHEINDEDVDGQLWDTAQNTSGGAAFPFPFVRCTLPGPAGSKYVEWRTHCLSGASADGRCNAANNEDMVTMSGFVDIPLPAHAIVDSQTYYLGAFVRYGRVNGRDIWLDSNNPVSWDKTLEFRGNGFRWGIGVGWPEGNYATTDHKFTFDIWCADTGFVGCQTAGNPGHKVQNDGGYSEANPFLADYDRWYAMVMKVTASTSTAGSAELFINGVRVTNKSGQVTFTAGGTIEHIEMLGTIGQTEYATPEHSIFMDRIVMSDSLADMQAAGLMSDPSAGLDTMPPAAPTALSVE